MQIVQTAPTLLSRHGPKEVWVEVDSSHPDIMVNRFQIDTASKLQTGTTNVEKIEPEPLENGPFTQYRIVEGIKDLSGVPRFVRLLAS